MKSLKYLIFLLGFSALSQVYAGGVGLGNNPDPKGSFSGFNDVRDSRFNQDARFPTSRIVMQNGRPVVLGFNDQKVSDEVKENSGLSPVTQFQIEMARSQIAQQKVSAERMDQIVSGLRSRNFQGVTSSESQVKFIEKNRADIVYDVKVPGQNQIERLNQRPEEFTGEKAVVLDALKKSVTTQDWVNVKSLSLETR